MRITSCLLLAVILLAFVGVAPAGGQDTATGTAAPTAGPQRQAFDKVFAQWKELLTELEQLQAKYRTASETEKVDIRKKYGALVQKGDAMKKELAQAAEKAFIEAPNADEEVTDLLLAVAAGNVGRDNYSETARLAKL
ncbi:MAG: hypothetical protein V3V75_10530, partial [Thermoguttaceae bacterium]